MNKAKREKKSVIKKKAIDIADYYANIACPLLTYQPKESKAVKLQIPLKQHADSDRTACCSASRGTE